MNKNRLVFFGALAYSIVMPAGFSSLAIFRAIESGIFYLYLSLYSDDSALGFAIFALPVIIAIALLFRRKAWKLASGLIALLVLNEILGLALALSFRTCAPC